MNIGVAIARSALRSPDATAVFEGERSLSYRQLDERTARLANSLLDDFGLQRGDRVALLVPNRTEVVEVLGGCAKAGLIYCGLNFRLAEAEYESIFENAGPRLLITQPEHAELAARLSDRHGIPVLQLDDADPDGYEARLAAASPAQPRTLHEVRPEDDFCIVYTSGTTGRPKGVLFDVRAVVQHATVAILEYELTGDSRWLMALPHNSSVQITLLPLLLIGGAVGFSDSRGFDALRFAEEVRRQRATHTYLVPTMLFRLLEAGVQAEDIPTLTTIGYGAAPIPPDRVRELVERFGPRFTQLYGMAEVCSIGTMLRKEDHSRAVAGEPRILASCGRASYAMDVRVVDDAGRDVEPGERGEVVFGSPYTMKCYYRDAGRTGEALIDGWMHSGDIAQQDEDGYVYIVDRKKDLIIRGGFNIVPSEIENVLYAHPAVLEAAVVGVPDAEWGEALLAVVALKEGSSADAAELGAWCRQQGLPSIKIPERVEFLPALPKNAVGKIAKRELTAAVSARAAAKA
jgi:acyl-CoA synthetase (AMP-forming)/AMP-acid ligase II